ncbi:RNA methyltransferase, putative [Plasmodium knowlesi strain H]|uniref:RNA methyltransferase, putative n=3 Tax=Plasmodium knowlesi TaxID=5850 RepID=A0A5K1VSN8_PLAKH|nr:RNA methyltransferase, putative [Plasmodium knowlesi strain H]OTN66578.1 putative RNA methyltransferase [Plasmodium knowlesi]CAA9986829.1 RNA methyltransferase, putative [Plasmodium knowlesi strain H]SBO23677.1 RNA methyltransferase, putative [Plasmodium knowlesi strain H]SBO25261.1 RNA methyltransferase, putative [Plasmodium knowlesi strain H]VVS76303.1 RNA methyltransferase, putative [Plasmodium knowlesi strain H]|eukprot:XP_002260687.1 hypothetical protein, conserved [Plasmodium knowlesi strain H]
MTESGKSTKRFIQNGERAEEVKRAKGDDHLPSGEDDQFSDGCEKFDEIKAAALREGDDPSTQAHQTDGTKKSPEKAKAVLNEDIKKCIEKRIPNVSRNLQVDLYVAIPSSIINNRSDVIKSYLTSYLARIFTVFSVSKVYIYDDQMMNDRFERREQQLNSGNSTHGTSHRQTTHEGDKSYHNGRVGSMHLGKRPSSHSSSQEGEGDKSNPEYSYLCQYLHYNLQYLETPQYLRKHLFPITHFLKHSGIMNPVDAPHHLRSDEWLPFREGVVVKKKSNGVIVDVGLFAPAHIENVNHVDIGTRVTVLFHPNSFVLFQRRNANVLFSGKLINPSTPKLYNLYWGYSVELLKRLSDVFDIDVDYIVGTSERGHSMGDATDAIRGVRSILIVFGNKQGLEDLLIKEREERKKKSYAMEKRNKVLSKMLKKFHLFVNTCPHQTSRTIRTEEAIAITLSLFHNILV